MPDPDPVGGVLRRPFTEQVAFFRRKLGNLVPTQRWDDMRGAAHDDGFMIAGAMKADLLADGVAAVNKAITEGRGIEDFRKDLRAIIARNGWTGWTGEGSIRGEAWRVRTIYRTNMTTSYAAGRYAQLVEGKFAFWVYRHGGSREPRPEHLSWDGVALPPDHPFWKTHYPPSDWGCSCYVVGASSVAAVRRLGGDPDKALPSNWRDLDPATGAPLGIGRGWDYAPGASVSSLVHAIAQRIGRWDYAIAKAFMGELPASRRDALSQAYRDLPSTQDDARRFAQAIYEDRAPAGNAPARTLGLAPDQMATRIATTGGPDIDGFDFRISQDSVRHVINEHSDAAIEASRGQRVVTAADFAWLVQIVSAPDDVSSPSRTASGELAVTLTKQIGTERFTAVFTINRGYRALTLKTLYIGVGKMTGATPHERP